MGGQAIGLTVWRCSCGKTARAVEAPVCHGQMRAVAVERPLPKRAPCCLGRKRG